MRNVSGVVGRILAACVLVAAAAPARATVSLSRTSASLFPTQSVVVTATITKGGLALPAGTHALTVTGLPAGVTVVPNPPTWSIPVGGSFASATSTFQFVVGPAAVAGGPTTITVTDPTVGGSAVFALTILEPTLTLGILTPTLTLTSTPATVFVRVTPDPGFGANVGAGGVPLVFSVDAAPPSAPAHVTAGGTKFELAPYSSTLPFPFSRTGAVTPGTYTVPVVATWPGTNHAPQSASANLTLSIPDISIVPPAFPVSVCNGGLPVSTSSFLLTPQFNYSGSPSLTVLSAPAGVTVTPPAVPPMPPGQSVTFTLKAAGAAAGNASATARVLDDPNVVNKTFPVAFTVINPDITASSSPSILSLQAGGAAQNIAVSAAAPPATCNATPIVDVTVLGLPPGFTFPAITTLNPPAYGPANLAVSAAVSVAAGSYPATLRFTPRNGATPQDRTVTITVTAGPDFNLGASPTSLTLLAGASGSISFSVLPLNGFAGTASVSIPAIQSVTATPSTFSLAAGGAPQSVSFLVSGSAAPGSYPATVSATAPGVPGLRTVNVTIVVLAQPDFTLADAPSSLTLAPGGSGQTTVSFLGVNGFGGPVSVAAPSIPAMTFSPASFSLAAGSTQVVTVTAAPGASPGSAAGDFTATAAGISGSRLAHVAVTITAVASAPDFTVAVTPAAPRIAAGRTADLTFVLGPIGAFAGKATVTPLSLPAGVTLAPAQPLLSPNVPQAATLSIPRATPPGAYTLVFRADEVPPAAARSPRPLLISKFVTVPLVVLPAAGGFSVSAVPPTVLASPGQPVAVRYVFRNLGDETLLITGDTFTRHDRTGAVFDSIEETVGLTLPPRGTASVSNTVLATGDEFARSGSPAIVFQDRTFRAGPDATGFIASATAPVAVTAANSLLATASVTRISVVYPPSGTLIGRGDNLRAQGILIGSGTGNLLVGWLYDGVLVETATVPLQNGTPTSITNSVTLPTLLAGNHEISLAVLAPNTLSSPSVEIYVDEGLTALRLVAPTAGSVFAPAFSAPTFSWIPAPGIARYGVGLRRLGAPGPFRWIETTETRWSPPAALWNTLAEGDYEWVVRGYTASGRTLFDRQNGGATAPPTSEGGTRDVADGWTVTSSSARFSIGAGVAALADLGGEAAALEGAVRFSWREIPGALYIHTLYVDAPDGPRRVRTEILPNAALLLPAAGAPKGATLWRVTAVDRDGNALGTTALTSLPGGAR